MYLIYILFIIVFLNMETTLIVLTFITSSIALISEILPFVKKTKCQGLAHAISIRQKKTTEITEKK